MNVDSEGFMEKRESQEYIDKLDAIMAWAEDQSDFDDSFILDLQERVENGSTLTAAQRNAVDNILARFGIEV